MNDMKVFSINWPNRIKYENEGEFDNSLFSDVYKKAQKYVLDIINDNKESEKKEKKENKDNRDNKLTYCNDENFNNIIPFLGERGMGKTSAMVSFALSLQKNCECSNSKYEGVEFYLLPRVDVGMMVKGENLLDIILAKMWTAFEKKMDAESQYDAGSENVKSNFTNVKKYYQLYIDSMKEKEKMQLTSTRELKELSRCLNLAEALKNLTKSYLQYMQGGSNRDSYMVITLDDLDVAIENVYLIMEQIRLFLNLPHVIVLVSADIGRLFLHYTKFFTEMLLPNNNYGKYTILLEDWELKPDEQIGRYVEGYLAKTFPHNRRIYLPEVSSLYENEYDIKCKENSPYNEEKNIRRLKYRIIQDITGIIWYPFGKKKDVLYNESLREIVNDLSELIDISEDKQNGSAHLLLNWIIRKIEEYSRNKADYKLQKFVSEMNGVDCSYCCSAH